MTNISSAITPANNSAITPTVINGLALPTDANLLAGDGIKSTESGIPYLAVITTRAHEQAYKKNGADIGIFFEESQAEMAKFTPNQHWQKVTDIPMGTDSKTGWMCTSFRWAQITQSEEVEVWQRGEGGISYVGPAFSRMAGGVTEWGAKAYACKGQTNPEFQMKRRLLVLPLNGDHTPLTERPVQLSIKGGFGTVYEQERRLLLEEIARAISIESGKSGNGKTLEEKYHPFVIMGGRLGLRYTDPQKSPFVYITERRCPLYPDDKKAYQDVREQKNGGTAREIVLHGCNWRDLLLLENLNPQTAYKIAEFYSQHAEFSFPGGRLPSQNVPVNVTNNDEYDLEF